MSATNMECPACKQVVSVDVMRRAWDGSGWHAHQPWLREAMEREIAGGMGDWGGPEAEAFYDRSVMDALADEHSRATGGPQHG